MSRLFIAPAQYHTVCSSYNEAHLYTFTLCINGIKGWRLPTSQEKRQHLSYIYRYNMWVQEHQNNIDFFTQYSILYAVPVKLL